MNKNLVLTICVGSYDAMRELTHPLIKAYADKIGADFFSIDSWDDKNHSSPHWEKFQIYDLLGKYERILYIDTDILVREDTPNLFDLVPKGQFGAFNENPWTLNRRESLVEVCKEYGIKLPNWNCKYYNSGVMIVSRNHREIFKHPGKEFFSFFEQGYINASIQKSETKIFDLPYNFNRMTCMDRVTGEERHASYLIHYAGTPNYQFTCELMKKDINNWKEHSPNYKYQRHILVDVQGGLGDQVDAEPTIRYMKKYIYPNDDIVVKTHWPRLFQHIEVPVYSHNEFIPKNDTPYYHLVTLPGPETIQWTIVSNLLCHTVDFVSMALLRRTLNPLDKSINLTINSEDEEEVKRLLPNVDLKGLVVIHAGKHWESKTMPKQWWQDICDGIVKEGYNVCLIGKDEETRGVWDLELREGMYDLKNLLSLGGLMYLLSQSQCLISNDSAPVHIAGAFDNKIILLPTCKSEWHILPYRGYDRKYKNIALYKKLVLDDCPQAPTEVHGASGEFLKYGWEEYLLPAEEIIKQSVAFIKDDLCQYQNGTSK